LEGKLLIVVLYAIRCPGCFQEIEYNARVVRLSHLPKADRLSVLAATILLAYGATRFINLTPRVLSLQLPGLFLSYELDVYTLVAILVAGLTATGADLLLRDHPALGTKRTFEHWWLPALTAWTLAVPLYQLPVGPEWVVGFLVGGALLMLVLVAEYIAVDPEDLRFPVARAGLTAVSFALFLLLTIAIRSAGLRQFLVLPALSFSFALVCLRTLHLRLGGQWQLLQTAALVLIVAQLAAGLHYWPLPPIQFGLAILGPAYALTSLLGSLAEGEPIRKALVEPAIVLFVVWGIAIWTS
jgi:hypothetical protein